MKCNMKRGCIIRYIPLPIISPLLSFSRSCKVWNKLCVSCLVTKKPPRSYEMEWKLGHRRQRKRKMCLLEAEGNSFKTLRVLMLWILGIDSKNYIIRA